MSRTRMREKGERERENYKTERVEWGNSRPYSFDVNLLGDGGHGGEAHNSPRATCPRAHVHAFTTLASCTHVRDRQWASQRQRPESLARPREGINRLIYYLESRSEFAKRGSHVHASKSTVCAKSACLHNLRHRALTGIGKGWI